MQSSPQPDRVNQRICRTYRRPRSSLIALGRKTNAWKYLAMATISICVLEAVRHRVPVSRILSLRYCETSSMRKSTVAGRYPSAACGVGALETDSGCTRVMRAHYSRFAHDDSCEAARLTECQVKREASSLAVVPMGHIVQPAVRLRASATKKQSSGSSGRA